ncbi:MAG: porin [Planctomycetota bacterium]
MLLIKPTTFLHITCASLLAPAVSAQDTADKPAKSVEERLAELEKKSGGDTMRVYWKDGLRLETADKQYKFRFAGRLNYDVAFFDPDNDTKTAIETGTTRIEDGSEFRRARIELSGEVAERTEWETSFDFAGGKAAFKNLFVGIKDLPFGNVRVGQFKEPFSLEQLTSDNNTTFMERSVSSANDPVYNAGLMVFDDAAAERMTWAVGAFRTGTDDGEISKGDGEWATTARVTGLPFYSEDGSNYVHLGLGFSRRSPTNDQLSFSSKPEANLAPAYVSIANLPAETVDLLGLEAAWVSGPLTVQSEYRTAAVDAPSGAGSDQDFDGFYAQASWFLTGENRPYRKNTGGYGPIKVKNNAFSKDHGLGAWELAARYSTIDLTDGAVDSGGLDDMTLGVNWYLNPNTKLMVNYVVADLDPAGGGAEGTTDILEFRVQFAY